MPTYARTGTGKWHVVGPDGCRYRRSFAAEETAPDDTVTATDIVAYELPFDPDDGAGYCLTETDRTRVSGKFVRNQRLVVLPHRRE